MRYGRMDPPGPCFSGYEIDAYWARFASYSGAPGANISPPNPGIERPAMDEIIVVSFSYGPLRRLALDRSRRDGAAPDALAPFLLCQVMADGHAGHTGLVLRQWAAEAFAISIASTASAAGFSRPYFRSRM